MNTATQKTETQEFNITDDQGYEYQGTCEVHIAWEMDRETGSLIPYEFDASDIYLYRIGEDGGIDNEMKFDSFSKIDSCFSQKEVNRVEEYILQEQGKKIFQERGY